MTGLAASVLAVALLAVPGKGRAAGPSGYDGAWSVLIITEQGTCDPAYSFPLQISNNRLVSNGMANVTGTVGRGGGVAVRVTAGGSYANGTGRLGGSSGSGRWSGRGSAGVCSGRWQATRS